jgi:dienelactone hydrolase
MRRKSTLPKLGLIFLPDIFGPTPWLDERLRLLDDNFSVVSLIVPLLAPEAQASAGSYGNLHTRSARADYLRKRRTNVRVPQVISDAEAAASSLKVRGCTAVVVAGFGMGGTIALRSARAVGAAAAVGWSTPVVAHEGTLDVDITPPYCKTTLFYGSDDDMVPASRTRALNEAPTYRDLQVRAIDGVGYGFADSNLQSTVSNPEHVAEAEALSWTIAFGAMTSVL